MLRGGREGVWSRGEGGWGPAGGGDRGKKESKMVVMIYHILVFSNLVRGGGVGVNSRAQLHNTCPPT